MSLTPSNMLELYTKLPNFVLLDVSNNHKVKSLDYTKDKPVIIAFICNHCPYVKHVIDQFTLIANRYQRKGFSVVAISSNDAKSYPEDSPEKMRVLAHTKGFRFPYCYDEDQSVARLYRAACTPDFYCFDKSHRLVYRGQFDRSRPNNDVDVTGIDLISAMDSVLSNKTIISEAQMPSLGCNIKWK